MTGPGHAVEQTWEARDGAPLAGTLQLPSSQWHERRPAVLLISGSGPLDRDSNMPGQRLDISRAFAEHLAERGIASLRYDKRGAGAFGGDDTQPGFDTETSDAADALDQLVALDHVDPDRISVVGHSVGATLAIRLAASTPRLAAIVLLAGAASSGARVLEWQSGQIGRTLPGPNWLTGRIFRAMQRRSHAKLEKPETDSMTAARAQLSGRWFREYVPYAPAQDLPRVSSGLPLREGYSSMATAKHARAATSVAAPNA